MKRVRRHQDGTHGETGVVNNVGPYSRSAKTVEHRVTKGASFSVRKSAQAMAMDEKAKIDGLQMEPRILDKERNLAGCRGLLSGFPARLTARCPRGIISAEVAREEVVSLGLGTGVTSETHVVPHIRRS